MIGFMPSVSRLFEREAVHGTKGLGEGEGGFGSRGDEKERTGVIADGQQEEQQDFGFWIYADLGRCFAQTTPRTRRREGFWSDSLEKRIDDLHTVVVLAMVEVFGVERLASQNTGSSDDGSVPVRDLEPATDGDGDEDEFKGDGLHRDLTGEFQGGVDIGLADAEGFLTQGIGNKLLEDLNGEGEGSG